MKFGYAIKDAGKSRETLCAFAIGNQEDGKTFAHSLADRLEDTRLRYKKKRAGKTGPFQVSFEILDQTAADNHLISSVRQLDRDCLQRLLLALNALTVCLLLNLL